MKSKVALFAGLLFGLGLVVSRMTDPAKVRGFLDVTGAWDLSLAFVMAGAVAVHFVLYRWILKRRSPLFAEAFQIPKRKDIDARLVVGAGLFGVGWGLSGVCPGPGLVDGASGSVYALAFVLAMTLGVILERRFLRKRT